MSCLAAFVDADANKWCCSGCFLKWEISEIKCAACESFRPGLTQADIDRLTTEELAKKQAVINMFRQPSATSLPSTGFTFATSSTAARQLASNFGVEPSGAGPALTAFGMGSSSAAGTALSSTPLVFGSSTQPASQPFVFGSLSQAPPSGVSPVSFSSPPLAAASASLQPQVQFGLQTPPLREKQVKKPSAKLTPIGHVFVHGSGELDQLGLGDEQRERKKPTLVRGIAEVNVHSVACGSIHVVCLCPTGDLISWGCNDDGALGRTPSSSDCEPGPVKFLRKTQIRAVSCGDCHTCALDACGHVWLWGSYKGSSGHIGISRGLSEVVEKCHTPHRVAGLPTTTSIASGAHHTLALAEDGRCFSWGANGTGQLALGSGFQDESGVASRWCTRSKGCAVMEAEVPHEDFTKVTFEAGSVKGVVAKRPQDKPVPVTRIRDSAGAESDAKQMTPQQLHTHMAAGAKAIILELPDREVSKLEAQQLLRPTVVEGVWNGVFASTDATFLTTKAGTVYGCGLNGDGQIGLGFTSLAVVKLQPVQGLQNASWIGGGLHMSAALVGSQVFAWGKAEECGLGLDASAPPVLKPQRINSLPMIRSLRCGLHHTLACSLAGDVFTWGCGLTHQLGNRPLDSSNPHDKDEDPMDALSPYLLSSKQLESSFVLLADGGAQHSVELAWNGKYAKCVSKRSAHEKTTMRVKAVLKRPAKAVAAKKVKAKPNSSLSSKTKPLGKTPARVKINAKTKKSLSKANAKETVRQTLKKKPAALRR